MKSQIFSWPNRGKKEEKGPFVLCEFMPSSTSKSLALATSELRLYIYVSRQNLELTCATARTPAWPRAQDTLSEREASLSEQDAGNTPQEALIRARHLDRSSEHKGEPLTARNL